VPKGLATRIRSIFSSPTSFREQGNILKKHLTNRGYNPCKVRTTIYKMARQERQSLLLYKKKLIPIGFHCTSLTIQFSRISVGSWENTCLFCIPTNVWRMFSRTLLWHPSGIPETWRTCRRVNMPSNPPKIARKASFYFYEVHDQMSNIWKTGQNLTITKGLKHDLTKMASTATKIPYFLANISQ
jgi:hypothetical protein